jgi:hypothetical protein
MHRQPPAASRDVRSRRPPVRLEGEEVVTETFGVDSRDSRDSRNERRTGLTVTPTQQEEAGRLGFSAVRSLSKTTASHGRDVLHPLILIMRGLRRGFGWFRAWWKRSSKDRRQLALVVVAVVLALVATMPRGPWILAGTVMGLAALGGRAPRPGEPPQQVAKLQAIYNGLVSYLRDEYDPDQTFQPGGDFKKAFDGWLFDEFGHLVKLELHYSPYFRDGEPEARAKVEQAIERKTGPNNDFLYEWDEEKNTLVVAVFPRRGMPATGGRPDAPATSAPGIEARPLDGATVPSRAAPRAAAMVEAPTGRGRRPQG